MDYSNLTLNQIIEKIKTSRFWDLPSMIAEAFKKLASITYTPPYKVYSALITQTGTDAPTAVVLENTIGEDFTWAYDSQGNYNVSKPTNFDINKTAVFTQSSGFSSSGQKVNIDFYSGNEVFIETRLLELGEYIAANDLLGNHFIEIRVYN